MKKILLVTAAADASEELNEFFARAFEDPAGELIKVWRVSVEQ